MDFANIIFDEKLKLFHDRKNKFEFYVVQKKYNDKKFYAVKSKKTFQELLQDKNIDLFKNFDFEKNISPFNEITFGLPISQEKTKKGQDFLRFFYELHKNDYTWSIRPVSSFFCKQYDAERILDGNHIIETIFERVNKFSNTFDSEIVFENDLFFVKEHVMLSTYENDLVPYAIKCKHNNSYYCYYMNDDETSEDEAIPASGRVLVGSPTDIDDDSGRTIEPIGTEGLGIEETGDTQSREMTYPSILGSDDNTYYMPSYSMNTQTDNSVQAEFRNITPVEHQPSTLRTLTPVSQNTESIIEQQTSPVVITQETSVIIHPVSDVVPLDNREESEETSNGSFSISRQQVLEQIQSEINNLEEGDELVIETSDEPPIPLDEVYCETEEPEENIVGRDIANEDTAEPHDESNIKRKKTFRLYGLKEFSPIYFKELQDKNDAYREGFIDFINNNEDFEIRLLKEIDFQIKDVAKIDAKDVKLKIKDLSPEYKKLYI